MAEQQLIDYIKKAKDAGQADEQTKTLLFKNGWTEAEVNDAFSAINQSQVAAQPAAEVDVQPLTVATPAEPEIQPQDIMQPQTQPEPQMQPEVQQEAQIEPQAQQQYQPQQSPEIQAQALDEVQPKNRKIKTILMTFLVVFVFVLIAAAAYYAIMIWPALQKNKTPVSQNVPTTPVQANTADNANVSTPNTPAETQPTPPSATATLPWCHTFDKNLGFADSGTDEVIALHTALQKEGLSYSPDGDNVYTQATALAVTQFETKYGIVPANGYVGVKTRAQLNKMYGCAAGTNP